MVVESFAWQVNPYGGGGAYGGIKFRTEINPFPAWRCEFQGRCRGVVVNPGKRKKDENNSIDE